MEQNKAPWWIPFAAVVGVLLALSIAWPLLVNAQPVGQPAIQRNLLITVTTAGTPVHVTTSHIVAASFMIEPVVGASVGIIYVCTGITSGTPSAACAASTGGSYQLGAQLSAASATVPGPTYNFYVPPPGVDLSTLWLDASVSGTVGLIGYFPHQ